MFLYLKRRWATLTGHDELKRIELKSIENEELPAVDETQESEEECAELSDEDNRLSCASGSGSSRVCTSLSESSRNSGMSTSSGSAANVCKTLSERSALSQDTPPASGAARKVFGATSQDCANVRSQLSKMAVLGLAEDWCIDQSEVRLYPDRSLGCSTCGVVVMGVFCGMQVAVKLPRGRIDGHVVRRVPELCQELRVLRRLRHPNLVTVHGTIIDPHESRIALVSELVRGKRLDRFLEGDAPGVVLPGSLQRYQIMIGVCKALMYMHSRTPPVMHGDVKHSSVLVEATGDGGVRPKLLDFGFTRVINRHAKIAGELLAWTPPEVLREGGPRRCHADIYALGHLIAYAATGKKPMTGRGGRDMKRSLLRGTYAMPGWPDGCSFQPGCQFLVERCLTLEEAQRPSAAQAHAELLLLPERLGLEGEVLELPEAVGWDDGAADMCISPRSAAAAPARNRLPRRAPPTSPVFEPVRHKGDAEVGLPTLPEAEPLHRGTAQTPTIYTDRHAKMISLLEAMSRWSCPPSQSPCCPFHDQVKIAEEVCRCLLSQACKDQAADCPEGKQCPNCGILGLEPSCRRCDVCSHSLTACRLPCRSDEAATASASRAPIHERVRVCL